VRYRRLNTLYVIDFDNTLVNTAEVIKNDGYLYDFEKLDFYEGASCRIRKLLELGSHIVILSKRKGIWKNRISDRVFKKFGVRIDVILVPYHPMKWIWVQRWSVEYRQILFIDDMMKAEETGRPRNLFFPPCFNSRIKVRRGERVFKWRSTITNS
jgi:hypothetical protein